jgi:scyllo-inositol 2-dehydrogenase (NADP+)
MVRTVLGVVALATPSSPILFLTHMVAPVVLIEKPVCIRAADAIELNQLARARRRILSVYQNRRWDGDFLTVKKVIASGQVGTLALSGVLLIAFSWEH